MLIWDDLGSHLMYPFEKLSDGHFPINLNPSGHSSEDWSNNVGDSSHWDIAPGQGFSEDDIVRPRIRSNNY